jgi:hypothetical protein
MEPVISPWIIYLISILSTIKDTAIFLVFISLVVITVLGIVFLVEDEEEKEKWKSTAKTVIKILIISSIVCIIVPDTETMISMLIFSYITPENIQLIQGNAVDFITKIIDIVNNK